jgi:DinB superfamily
VEADAMTDQVAAYPRFSVSAATREMSAARDGLNWALPLISEKAAHAVRQTGDWSVATNLAHLVIYEERIALPVLAALADGEDGRDQVVSGEEDWLAQEAQSLGAAPYSTIREQYQSIINRHLEQLRAFDEETFNAALCSLWAEDVGGLVPAGWVTKKSVQHTWEHGHTLIRAGWVSYAVSKRR